MTNQTQTDRLADVLHQMATFQDGNAQDHTIALINELADVAQSLSTDLDKAQQRIAELEAEIASLRSIPQDIAEAVTRIGEAEWGATAAQDDAAHADAFANSLRLTREHFGTEGPQQLHGVYLKGAETVLCHTGTSPNSAVHAQALTGAWNWLLDQSCAALNQPKESGDEG